MNSDDIIITVAIVLLIIAFLSSLARRVLANILSRNIAEHELAENKSFKEIKKIAENEDYDEITFQGYSVSGMISIILLSITLKDSFITWIVIMVCVYLVTFFIPKILSMRFPDTLLRFCIYVFRALRYLFFPSVKISSLLKKIILKILNYDNRLSFLSELQREAITDETGENTLEEKEKQMIRNIFEFADTPVREIMTPRVEMHTLNMQSSLSDSINALNSERYSRLPVYKDSIDNIIGILSNREFLEWYTERQNEPFDLQKLVRPAIFVPPTKKIDKLLLELRESNNHLAIVVDEYGGTAGLVTMEDILEEIVGDIKDEDDFEEDSNIVKLPTGQYQLDPLITLSDLATNLDVHFSVQESEHIDTLSGLIQFALNSIPEEGTSVQIQGYMFKIKKMDGTKIKELVMEIPNPK